MPITHSPPSPLTIAALPRRLEAAAYPLHTSLRLRWSDIQEDRVSRVALAHFFEDIRIHAIRKLMHSQGLEARQGDAVLRAVTIEHLAPASIDTPYLDMAAGIASVGKTSFAYALAAFQNGQCVAVGSAVHVRVANGQPAAWDDNMRAMLQHNLMAGAESARSRTGPGQPQAYPWSLALHARFSDTDSVGHLNNVSMSRYHDNAAVAFIREALGHVRADDEGRRLSVVRQDLSIDLETHYPETITLQVAVVDIQSDWFTLAIASEQGRQRTSTSTAVVAWVDQAGQTWPLSGQLLARLRSFQVQA